MSQMVICEICTARILSHARIVTCNLCNSIYHVRCLPHAVLNSNDMFNSDICLNCLSSIFPFNHISSDREFTDAISNSMHNSSKEFLTDEHRIFDPLNLNNIENSQYEVDECDPDLNFYNDYICVQNIQNCSYYLEYAFIRKISNCGLNKYSFSLIHFNIKVHPGIWIKWSNSWISLRWTSQLLP